MFDTEEGVLKYEQMANGHDGRDLVERLRRHVPEGARVLELGMGPGKDLDMLRQKYEAVGSDSSPVFLERYRQRSAFEGLLLLDAITLKTTQTFDAIYSNKVLHQLTPEELRSSLERQVELLTPGGIALHSLWYGEGEEDFGGMKSVSYDETTFEKLMPPALTMVEQGRYAEMDAGDSLFVVLKKA